MPPEPNLYYLNQPHRPRPVAADIEFLAVQDFLSDEPACRVLWELISDQFRTRSKFFAIWSAVRYVVVHRGRDGVDGLLIVSALINWQIDYVVVKPECRRQGIAAALVDAALNRAFELGVPYVMLTSREELRPLYEGTCGFRVVAHSTNGAIPEFCPLEA